MSDFKELYQEGTLQDYMDTFDMLASQLKLLEDYLTSCFLLGLKPEIQYPFCMFQPQSLKQAFTLAKLQEATLISSRQNLKIT